MAVGDDSQGRVPAAEAAYSAISVRGGTSRFRLGRFVDGSINWVEADGTAWPALARTDRGRVGVGTPYSSFCVRVEQDEEYAVDGGVSDLAGSANCSRVSRCGAPPDDTRSRLCATWMTPSESAATRLSPSRSSRLPRRTRAPSADSVAAGDENAHVTVLLRCVRSGCSSHAASTGSGLSRERWRRGRSRSSPPRGGRDPS